MFSTNKRHFILLVCISPFCGSFYALCEPRKHKSWLFPGQPCLLQPRPSVTLKAVLHPPPLLLCQLLVGQATLLEMEKKNKKPKQQTNPKHINFFLIRPVLTPGCFLHLQSQVPAGSLLCVQDDNASVSQFYYIYSLNICNSQSLFSADNDTGKHPHPEMKGKKVIRISF